VNVNVNVPVPDGPYNDERVRSLLPRAPGTHSSAGASVAPVPSFRAELSADSRECDDPARARLGGIIV